MQSFGFRCFQVDVTPTVTAAAYSAGNQVGGIQTLTKGSMDTGRFAKLNSLTILDIDNQKAALDILLFWALPTVASSDKVALSITVAQMKANCIGRIAVAAASYVTLSSQAVAFNAFTDTYLQSNDNAANLYAVVSTSGTPTYTTTASLVFKWVFSWHF